MDAMKTCLELLAAESEAGVQNIINSTGEMGIASNWKPLDGRETNFNMVSNQASDGGKALTELMTNMVDAVLTKHALLKGIDPKSSNAPQTMYEAVDTLIKNLHGGKLVNLDTSDPWLKDFAQKNLVIGVTGAKAKREGLPSYTFVDNGEGQNPEDFKGTFLSLSAGNKKNIPFVQGKFNMGSSGVLGYCGRSWFKLIVSRRYDKNKAWAWTLIRRRPGDGDDLPIAEYFVLSDGSVPKFEVDILYPFHTMQGNRYDGVSIESGTVVKLFDYQVGSKFLSFKGTREAFYENLVETILPFRLLDFRQFPKSQEAREKAEKRGGDRALGIDPRPFYGMEFLLLRSHKEEGGAEEAASGMEKVFVGNFSDPELGEVSISAILLKREIPGWLKPPRSNIRIFHAVNGQVQFKQTRGYLSQSCGFPALKDRVVIVVDASNLTFSAHNDVWKGDREHIRNTIIGERYKNEVTETIRNSSNLDELQKRIAKEELERATKTESNALFQKLVDSDRNLAGLLSSRDPTIVFPTPGGRNGNENGRKEWKEGKYSPTFIRLEERHLKREIEIPINKSRPIAARTDAENDYLQRTDNRGKVLLDERVLCKFRVREHLVDGRLTLVFNPLENALQIGDSFRFTIGLKDDAMAASVESEEVIITITNEVTDPPKSPRADPIPPKPHEENNDKKPGKRKNAPTLGLPPLVLLTKDGRDVGGVGTHPWPQDFNEHDGGLIEDLGDEGLLYKINWDNSYHTKYRMQQRGDNARDVISEKYILGMRILLLGFEHARRAVEPEGDNEEGGMAEFVDDFRRAAARGAASTVLALAENLPNIVDESAGADELE